jgi:hypothetical protein
MIFWPPTTTFAASAAPTTDRTLDSDVGMDGIQEVFDGSVLASLTRCRLQGADMQICPCSEQMRSVAELEKYGGGCGCLGFLRSNYLDIYDVHTTV